MTKVILILCALFAFMQCRKNPADSQQEKPAVSEVSQPAVNNLAIVNADYLRIREAPSTESSILGRLMKSAEVLVLQKTKEKSTVGSSEEYWYELVTIEGIRGWAFGQFLTLKEKQGEASNFPAKYERSSEMPEQDIDLSIANGYEKRKMYSEADIQYNQLPDSRFIQYLVKERKLLRKASFTWLRDNQKDIYNEISERLSKKSSIMPLLPPSIDLGTYASEFWGIFSNSELNDFLHKNLQDGYSISDLVLLEDGQAVFYIDQKNWGNHGDRLMFCIFKIEGAAIEKLNNKHELASVMFSTSGAYADPQRKGFSIKYPYYKRWVYGIDPLLEASRIKD